MLPDIYETLQEADQTIWRMKETVLLILMTPTGLNGTVHDRNRVFVKSKLNKDLDELKNKVKYIESLISKL